ncbi:MAG: UvrB/UvrC motif-containing protein [Oscillospiraceae bacterium]|jgi:protein arginine kinase activator|nr:UvrB/UvrC motif-containing protein [Oscillospiraceae bacterium]
MLCEQCGKREATTFLSQRINDDVTEKHLCAQCAAEAGLNLIPGGISLADLFGSVLATGTVPPPKSKTCPQCGATMSAISKVGKVGCAECYRTFREELLPSLQRMHGTVRYMGKAPCGAPAGATPLEAPTGLNAPLGAPSPASEKREALKQAIAEERYEDAAMLRDEIRKLEEGV